MKRFYIFIFSFFILCAFSHSILAQGFPAYYFSADLLEYPSVLDGETVKEYVNFDYLSFDTKYLGDEKFTTELMEPIVENMDVQDIPESVHIRFGFTLESVNMRRAPSQMVLHKGNPNFDMMQYTRVGASSPVAVLHSSADEIYYYVQIPFMRGWIPKKSVILYDEKKFKEILALPSLRIKKDGMDIGGIRYFIGNTIPIEKKKGGGYNVILPDGRKAYVKKSEKSVLNKEEFSPAKIKKIAEALLGAPYDWGGKKGFRDCSSFVRDLWLVFGVNLPRNTALQSVAGKELLGKPESKKEFYEALSAAKPFKTLIFFKGHVMLYGGMEKGDFIVYHAVNSLRNDFGEKAVIASVVKQMLFRDHYSSIWERVVKVVEIDH